MLLRMLLAGNGKAVGGEKEEEEDTNIDVWTRGHGVNRQEPGRADDHKDCLWLASCSSQHRAFQFQCVGLGTVESLILEGLDLPRAACVFSLIFDGRNSACASDRGDRSSGNYCFRVNSVTGARWGLRGRIIIIIIITILINYGALAGRVTIQGAHSRM